MAMEHAAKYQHLQEPVLPVAGGRLHEAELEASLTELEAVLLEDVRGQLERWRRAFSGRPEAERAQLLLFALEREQIVAVAYREEAVAGRVAELDIGDDARALIRQTLIWIWKDEQLHSEFTRGLLLDSRGLASSLVVYGRQIQGALSGWTSATATNREARSAPFRTGAASVLVAAAAALNRMPAALGRELRYQTFRRYCALNVALEASAEFAYRRLVQVASSAEEGAAFDRIRDDEARHTAAFRLLTDVLTDDDHLVPGLSADRLAEQLSQISAWFVPATQRVTADEPEGRRSFASRAPVVVRSGRTDRDKAAALEECLDRAGLDALASRASLVAIRASFMLGYDRADRSNVNDPELVDFLARYLRRHGVPDVAVLEAPTVYGNLFANRSVASVASYFGFDSPSYRIVDISQDLRARTFDRGFVQKAISATWLDSDLRIVMPKLRTDPTEFAHLSLSTLEGSTGAIDDTFYAGRRVDFRSATMMLLDVAAPDFAIVDGWAPVADGPFGVMGCHRPAEIRHIYAGPDALAVDEAVLADLGIADARRAPIVAQAYHWFGLQPAPLIVDGVRPPLGRQLRGAHASALLRGLGAVSYPGLRLPQQQGGAVRAGHGHRRIPPDQQVRCRNPLGALAQPAGIRAAGPGAAALMGLSRAQVRGVLQTIRAGHAPARVLAITDSRAVVRSLFLASAVRIGLLDRLREGRSFAEIAELTHCLRSERLQAWLDIGTELGEISQRAGRYRVRGRRARAIAAGDTLLRAHYRSMLDYQTGPYADLEALLRSGPGEGRADLDQYADDIARVSLAAVPFVASYLTRVIGEARPARILDVGCGTAVYSKIAAGADPRVQVDGIDLAETVIDAARADLRSAGLGERIRLHVGDIRSWTPESGIRYDLILLLNNVYYFPREERVPLYRQLRELLRGPGQLIVASLTAPGSIAAAHLNFMLTCQTGAAALPRSGELETDLSSAGFDITETRLIVPTEPFVAVKAARL